MPDTRNDRLIVHVNVEISAAALQAIVANAKRMAAKDADGICRVDTADQLSIMISRFLDEKDFDNYVLDFDNYTPQAS
jgi:ribosome maturation factor RimP